MIKRFPRLLLCTLLCAALALSPLAALGEGMQTIYAQLALTMPDGSQQVIPVDTVTTSMGDNVYWVDSSMFLPEQLPALASGTLLFTDETGNVLAAIPYTMDPATDVVYDMPVEIADPQDPEVLYTLLFTAMTAPEDGQAADEALAFFGYGKSEPLVEYITPEPTEEPTEEPTPEPTEEPTPEPTEEPTPEPTEEPTPEPTEEPTPEPTEEPTPEPTEEPTPEPTEEPTPEPVILPQTPFYVMADNLYANGADLYHSVEGEVIWQIDNGTVLFVYEAVAGSDASIWYAVVDPLDEEIYGFVRADVTTNVTEEDAAAYFDEIEAANQPTAEPTAAPTEEPTAEPVIDVIEPATEPTDEPVVEAIVPPAETVETVTQEPTAEPAELPSTPFYAMADNLYGNGADLYHSVEGEVIWQIDNGTLLFVYEALTGSDASIWYAVVDPLDEEIYGFVRADVTTTVTEEDAKAYFDEIEAANQPTAEPTAEPTEEPTAEPVVDVIEPTAVPVELPQTPFYTMSDNLYGNYSDLYSAVYGEVIGTLDNGTVLYVHEAIAAQDASVWYAVSDPLREGVYGFIRADLTLDVSEEDALAYLAEMTATPVPTEVPTEAPAEIPTETPTAEPTAEPTQEPVVELITPAPTDAPQSDAFYAVTNNQNSNVNNLRESIGGSVIAEITNGELMQVSETTLDGEGKVWYAVTHVKGGVSGYMRDYLLTRISDEDAQTIQNAMNTQPPKQDLVEMITPPAQTATPAPTMDFPAYGITVDSHATIVLRTAPAGDLPNSGAIPRIDEPTPLELIAGEYAADGSLWYLVTSMRDGMSGYVEAHNVNIVTKEQAEAAAKQESATPLPPPATEVPVETPTPIPTPTPTAEPTPTPIPEEPQELRQGDVYHYGRTNKAQVNLREKAKQSSDSLGKMAEGTVLWVMTLDGEWANVRADMGNGSVKTGYMKSEFITLMGENEEIAYRATLTDPEIAPETPTPAPTEPLVELITPVPTEAPTATPEVTATPEITATPTVEPTQTPLPTSTPAPLRLDLYARVLNDATPLRGNPDANAYLQTILDAETVVYIFQSQVAADGMTWYLVQYSGQWGFIRADLVRIMGAQETEEYKAALDAALATPTPMPQATPEPVGPDSTSAYAKLIKDAVNLRRTPSASGTSLGRIPVNTLLLVLGEEFDGTYTWYQVNYNGQDGFVRSDMAQMLTIAQLQEYLAQQAQATPAPVKPGSNPNANPGNNVDYVINGSPLQDLIPVPDGWTSNVVDTLPGATATPDPNATATPVPVSNPAALISSMGTMTVSNVPASTQDGSFTVYGKTTPYAYVKAMVDMSEVTQVNPVSGQARFELIASAIAEAAVMREVGSTTADASGNFTMNVKLPQPGEYIVEFTANSQNFARYGVTYDAGVTPAPIATAAPLPTTPPIEEEGGFGALPLVIGGLLIVVIAVIYGVHVYNRRAEEAEEEDEEGDEDLDEEDELREQQRVLARQRRSANAPGGTQIPPYMKKDAAKPGTAPMPQRTSPFARPADKAPKAPTAPVAPKAPTMPTAPVMPKAPAAPAAPVAPVAPKAPDMPKPPVAADVPTAEAAPPTEGQPRRRRRNPNA